MTDDNTVDPHPFLVIVIVVSYQHIFLPIGVLMTVCMSILYVFRKRVFLKIDVNFG